MRRLIFPALILLPVLAHAQAKTQTSTLTAVPSSAPVATLVASANTPKVLPAASAPASADNREVMVPIHQTVVERTSDDVDVSDSTLSYSFSNGVTAMTAPKLIQASPLTLSLQEMEAQSTESSVQLQLTVDPSGTPRDVKVVRSGGAILDKRAVEAVSKYHFKAATQNSIPVNAQVTIAIKIKKS
jgi:TonB family protein